MIKILGVIQLSKKAFHIYNFFIFPFGLSFNALTLFEAGMSEGGVHPYMWFGVGASFVILYSPTRLY
ncbi:hypothetical protein ACTWPF_03935 [Oceanobacillus sp. M65]|uniref:hypothetical protein n=1 Tax=Oceanobacillus sp. M65 TaxID=3457435 RepID=UPI003FCEBDFC